MEEQTELENQLQDGVLMRRNSYCKQESESHKSNDGKFAIHDPPSGASSAPTECEDDEEESQENEKFKFDEMRFSDARMGMCSICRYQIKGTEATLADFEKALLCSDGHLLCCRCVQNYAIQSDTNCALCAATEAQRSPTSVSGTSSVRSIRPKRRHRAPALRSRRDRRAKEEDYKAPTSVSQTDVAARYGIACDARSGEENWGETEHEDANEEDEEELEIKLPHVRSVPMGRSRSYSSLRRGDPTASAIGSRINSRTMAESSRRPIQCPRLDCAVNVAFSALTNHFIFDHPEVPILIVDPGERSTLIVNFDGLIYDSSRCLALLLVSGKLSGPAARQFNGSHIHPRYKNRLPLPILAARLRCNTLCAGSEDGYDDGRDVVIAWIAGLDIGNTTTGALRCSIQAVDTIDEEAFRSLTYTGPINSLRTAQKPREVLFTGDCVILHDGFINHITSGCESLNVNVTIH